MFSLSCPPSSTPSRPGHDALALDRRGLQRFFAVWESALAEEIATEEGPRTIRDLYRRQAERLARAIQHGEPSVPFALPC